MIKLKWFQNAVFNHFNLPADQTRFYSDLHYEIGGHKLVDDLSTGLMTSMGNKGKEALVDLDNRPLVKKLFNNLKDNLPELEKLFEDSDHRSLFSYPVFPGNGRQVRGGIGLSPTVPSERVGGILVFVQPEVNRIWIICLCPIIL